MTLTAIPRDTSEQSASVLLRGTERGLEIVVDPDATVEKIAEELVDRLRQSPGFFAGSDVRVRCEGPLPSGTLGRLEAIAGDFDLRIVELGPPPPRKPLRLATAPALPPDAAAPPPSDAPAREGEPAPRDPTGIEAGPPPPPPAAEEPAGPTPHMQSGPIRSGVVVDVPGHLVVVGDVNPGAEVRAGGNVIVLGSLRGVAHAGCAGRGGFILALRLAPHQLRIGELIARAGDAAEGASVPEIAFATDGRIIVEPYRGKLPGALSGTVDF